MQTHFQHPMLERLVVLRGQISSLERWVFLTYALKNYFSLIYPLEKLTDHTKLPKQHLE